MIDNISTKFQYLLKRKRLAARVAINYLKLFSGGLPLRTVHIAPEWTCNATCPHCYSVPFHESVRKTLNIDEWNHAVEECIKMGAINFVFQGGEPLVSDLTIPLIRIIKRRGGYPVVNTNGILLAEKILSLKAAGIDWINVSINGIGESHDQFYNHPGLFDISLHGIELAQKAGIHVIVVTIATNKSLESGETLRLAQFMNKRKIDTWLVYPMLAGRWIDHPYERLSEENIKRFDELLKNKFIHWEGEGNYFKYGCAAGRESIYVSAYGDVTPCAGICVSFGNIIITPLRDILNKMRQVPYFHDITNRCMASVDEKFHNKFIAPFKGREGAIPIEQVEFFYSISLTNPKTRIPSHLNAQTDYDGHVAR